MKTLNLDLSEVKAEVWATRNNIKERVCEKLEELNPGYEFRWDRHNSFIYCSGQPLGRIITNYEGPGCGYGLKAFRRNRKYIDSPLLGYAAVCVNCNHLDSGDGKMPVKCPKCGYSSRYKRII